MDGLLLIEIMINGKISLILVKYLKTDLKNRQ